MNTNGLNTQSQSEQKRATYRGLAIGVGASVAGLLLIVIIGITTGPVTPAFIIAMTTGYTAMVAAWSTAYVAARRKFKNVA
ncbi:hypothetical protein [Pseudoclavibacter helvolus]|uniref:Uncharacterized protein n=1 Tax=Pseudoclavibacter helvolus TaxID=255205 RepID=A0A7W4URS5_9MICO|nr:hypothetical protein [Pseudoclavibacter helvolus]MBB2959396.1 hypothetical protein [Pseudoclavibacter helvolus]